MVLLLRSPNLICWEIGCVFIVWITVYYLWQHASVYSVSGDYGTSRKIHKYNKHEWLKRDPRERRDVQDVILEFESPVTTQLKPDLRVRRVVQGVTPESEFPVTTQLNPDPQERRGVKGVTPESESPVTRQLSTTTHRRWNPGAQPAGIGIGARDESVPVPYVRVTLSDRPAVDTARVMDTSKESRDARDQAPVSSSTGQLRTGWEKLILFWTRFNVRKPGSWWEPPGGFGAALANCNYQSCHFSRDKALIQRADVVVFKERYLERDGVDWPAYRSQRQLYVHLLGERPGPWHDFLRDYNSNINLTMNYRASADIPTPHKLLYRRQPPFPGPYTLRVPFHTKTGMVVWAASNCAAESRRQDYVRELAKYIAVDVYGACGNLICEGRKSASCYDRWERKYKFYLSFENAICDDYITEKYHKPLKYELVPVVLSGHRYNSRTPPHSAIDVRDFASPRDLARYLTRVGADEREYSRYFQWKQSYVFRTSQPGPLCGLCEAAHTTIDKPAIPDYHGWWFGACDNELVDRMRATGDW